MRRLVAAFLSGNMEKILMESGESAKVLTRILSKRRRIWRVSGNSSDRGSISRFNSKAAGRSGSQFSRLLLQRHTRYTRASLSIKSRQRQAQAMFAMSVCGNALTT